MEYNLSEIDEGEQGILVFDFQSQGTCEHKSRPGDSVLEEHIIEDFFPD